MCMSTNVWTCVSVCVHAQLFFFFDQDPFINKQQHIEHVNQMETRGQIAADEYIHNCK